MTRKIDISNGFKLCSKCKIQKPLSDFNRRTDYTYSYMSHCKSCLCDMSLYHSAKTRAKKNKLEFDLDLQWIREKLLRKTCEATGVELSLDINTDYRRTYNRPSIDRIDNSKGYTKDNCQVVSVIYNMAKNEHTDKELIEMSIGLLKMKGII